MAYGHVNSVILLVDLCRRKSESALEPAPLARPAIFRIREYLDQWNKLVIDAVFGLLTEDSIKYICLFVNKLDVMQDQTPTGMAKYEKAFLPLITILRERAKKERHDLDVKVIVGSVLKGAGINELRNDLNRNSVPGLKSVPNTG